MEKTFHERLRAVLAGQKVEEFKARHAYLHGVGMSREEYGTFWLRSDHSTFGHTFGRMMGFRELVPAHFGNPVSDRMGPPGGGDAGSGGGGPGGGGPGGGGDDQVPGDGGQPFGRQHTQVRTDRPTKIADILGGELERYGHNDHGTFAQSCHVLASPVVEVAEDGQSARSFYLTPGTMMNARGQQGGRSGSFLWERYGSDFVYRDGRWWWFHEQVCPDVSGAMDDENWAQDRFRDYLAGKLQIGRCSGAPASGISDLRSVHKDISIIQTVQDTVPDPKPYERLDEEHTYSPGCSDFSGYIYPASKGFGDYLY